jgi:hypothetical protein
VIARINSITDFSFPPVAAGLTEAAFFNSSIAFVEPFFLVAEV